MNLQGYVASSPSEVRSDLRAMLSYALDSAEKESATHPGESSYLDDAVRFRSMLQSITDGNAIPVAS